MRPEMGPPDTTIYEYPGADTSWAAEWAAFQRAVEGATETTAATLADAAATLRVVDLAYKRA
jgi:predicted dehydrogenase